MPRLVLRRLAVLALIMVVAAVSFQLYLAFDRSQTEPEESFYASIPDTGGPARGQAQTFSQLLRARGLVCSDENLAQAPMISRPRTAPSMNWSATSSGPRG